MLRRGVLVLMEPLIVSSGLRGEGPSTAAHPAASPETPGTAPARATPGQQQGILRARPQRLLQPRRVPPLLPWKPVNLFPSPPSAHLSHLGRCPGQGQEQERLGQMSEPQRPRRGSLPPAPSVTPGRRYSSIWLPRGFYHLCLGWLDVFPPPGPLASGTPAASWWLTLRRMLRPLRMMPILLSGPRVWFAKFRYRWEVVVIFLLDVWAGLPGGVGSLVPAQGREGTLTAPVAGEAHDGNLPLLPPGLAQVSHSVKGAQPREAAGESRAASSTWRAKSTRWRSGWTNDCLGEESASSWSPPGESKVPACLDVAQRGRGWQQGPREPFLSWPSPCGDGLEPAPTLGMQSRDSRRDAQGLL